MKLDNTTLIYIAIACILLAIAYYYFFSIEGFSTISQQVNFFPEEKGRCVPNRVLGSDEKIRNNEYTQNACKTFGPKWVPVGKTEKNCPTGLSKVVCQEI